MVLFTNTTNEIKQLFVKGLSIKIFIVSSGNPIKIISDLSKTFFFFFINLDWPSPNVLFFFNGQILNLSLNTEIEGERKGRRNLPGNNDGGHRSYRRAIDTPSVWSKIPSLSRLTLYTWFERACPSWDGVVRGTLRVMAGG